jgi:hypothetical protein
MHPMRTYPECRAILSLWGFLPGLFGPALPLCALLCVLPPRSAVAGVFDVGGKAPDSVIAAAAPLVPAEFSPRSPMLDQLGGILAVLTPDQIRDLRACASGRASRPIDFPASSRPVAFLHLRRGEETRLIEIVRSDADEFIARDTAAGPRVKATRLDAQRFASLALPWPRYRGLYRRPPDLKAGDVLDMPKPHAPGWFTVDHDLLGERFNGGRPSQVAPARRSLQTEALRLRIPRRYEGHLAAGIVIWVDAAPDADLHAQLHAACD